MYPPDHYLLRWRGQQSGPFPLAVIEHKLDEHKIGLTCEIQCSGHWITLDEFFTTRDEQRKRETVSQPVRTHHDLVPSSLPSSLAASVVAPATIPVAASRRRIIFALLGIFLGFFGAHNFYAGYTRIGILQLVLTGLATLLGFNLIFTWLWALIEVLFVHNDSQGVPLS